MGHEYFFKKTYNFKENKKIKRLTYRMFCMGATKIKRINNFSKQIQKVKYVFSLFCGIVMI